MLCQHPHGIFQEHPHRRRQIGPGVQGDAQRDGCRGIHRQHGDVADPLLRDKLVHHAHPQPLLHHGHGGKALDGGELHIGHDARPVEQRRHVVIAALGGHDEPVCGAVGQRIDRRPGQRVISP